MFQILKNFFDFCNAEDRKRFYISIALSLVQAMFEALKIPAIAEMAKKYGVSVPQLCIRYDIQLGMIVLPKTANPEHMKHNADVEFVISDEDMDVLKRIERIKDYGDSSFFPVYGGKLKGYSGRPGSEKV